jgi:hypothetical protein
MSVDKMSISLESALAAQVRQAAEESGDGLSRWMADAARARLRRTALREFFDDYERRHGAFTHEDMVEASKALGLPPPPEPEQT